MTPTDSGGQEDPLHRQGDTPVTVATELENGVAAEPSSGSSSEH